MNYIKYLLIKDYHIIEINGNFIVFMDKPFKIINNGEIMNFYDENGNFIGFVNSDPSFNLSEEEFTPPELSEYTTGKAVPSSKNGWLFGRKIDFPENIEEIMRKKMQDSLQNPLQNPLQNNLLQQFINQTGFYHNWINGLTKEVSILKNEVCRLMQENEELKKKLEKKTPPPKKIIKNFKN